MPETTSIGAPAVAAAAATSLDRAKRAPEDGEEVDEDRAAELPPLALPRRPPPFEEEEEEEEESALTIRGTGSSTGSHPPIPAIPPKAGLKAQIEAVTPA